MRALLLAAGLGTRLMPLTKTTPKCLVLINDRPLLDYWLDILFDAGIERVCINTHWLADTVRAHVKQTQYADRIDFVYEETLLGTAGTILANRDYFRDETFLVAHADNLTDFNLTDFIAVHRARPLHCAMSLLAFRTDDPSSCGILECDNLGVVKAFHEKVDTPPGNLANGAVYLVEPEVIHFASATGRQRLDLSTEIIPHFMGRILAVDLNCYHRDIGNIESLRQANIEFKRHS